LHCLLCRIEKRVCALPLVHVLEVMRPVPLAQVASAPAFLLGLLTVRGELTPVVDVAALLDGERITRVGRFVAMHLRELRMALAVNEVLGTRSFERQLLGRVPPLLSRDAPAPEALAPLDAALLATLDGARVLDQASAG
jgi:purine-binding chemotaxis protein CheW